MRVTFINRARNSGGFSIEELFMNIQTEMENKITISSYFYNPKKSLLQNIYNIFKLKSDVYHITGGVYYLVLFLNAKKTILTVHDIGHFTHTLKGIKKRIYKIFWLVFPFKKARLITTVSEETKRNILKYFPLPSDKIMVIPNCYPKSFQYTPKTFNSLRPRILQVGVKEYKNVERLIDALRGINCKLVLIGKLDSDILKKIRVNSIAYENYCNLTHSEVYDEYKKSDIVTLASLGEGFGLPIIESQAVGRPVITSNIPPMSEIAGKAACLVNPLDAQDIRKGILRVINDSDYREGLIKNGLENIKCFHPEVIASLYLEKYYQIYNKSPY